MNARSSAFVAALAAVTGFASISYGQATTQPSVVVTVDGVNYPIPLSEGRKGYQIGSGDQGYFLETPGATVQISGELNPDPSINYGLAVTDFGAPSAFAFLFLTPIVPTGSPNTVNASVVGGLTDAAGDGVTITPTGAFLQTSALGAPATNMGVDVGLPVSGGPGPAGSLYPYGAFASGSIPGPGPGPWTTLSTFTAFSLSGGGDIAALTGSASIVEVPSPSLAWPAAAFLLATLRPRARRQA